jgi:quinol monooxygenase YgiN
VPDRTDGGSNIITFIATTTIKPEHVEEYAILVATTAEMIRTHEPDTLLHVIHRHPTKPDTFVAIERYRNAEALKSHAEAPYLEEARRNMQNWLAKPHEVLQLTEIASDVHREP